jgi:hypothetical protein
MKDEAKFYINADTFIVWCESCVDVDDDLGSYFSYGYLGYPEDRLTCSQCDAVIQIK